jgi:hypothetical protein
VIVKNSQIDTAITLQSFDKGGYRAVTDALDPPIDAIDRDGSGNAAFAYSRLG